MAYHEELLQLAFELALKTDATQADLRRCVSTAYYALFHLLVSETMLNWGHAASRNALGRMLDHRPMKDASNRVLNPEKMPFSGKDPKIVAGLRSVARAFVDLQNQRHLADYDNGTVWTQEEAIEEYLRADTAVKEWNEIRHTDIAQEYLVSLLIRSRD